MAVKIGGARQKGDRAGLEPGRDRVEVDGHGADRVEPLSGARSLSHRRRLNKKRRFIA